MIPAFFSGWLTTELAPHLLALNAAGAALHVRRHGTRGWDDRLALALQAVSAAGYVKLIRDSQLAMGEIEDALREALGDDYASGLEREPDADDLATPWGQLAMPFRMANDEVVRESNIAYAEGGKRYRLDVYHGREPQQGRPVLLQVHGGGWVIGHKAQQGVPLMQHMAERGWICVAPNYPLSPRAKWPEHVVALKRAIAWVRENIADYGGDPSFLAVTGGSAGGHLAALLALTSDDKSWQPGFEDADTSVQACVPHYGVYDFAGQTNTAAAVQRREEVLGRVVMPARYEVDPQSYLQASPLERITEDAPPFLVIHGRLDSLVPVAEAREFVQRLREISHHPVAYAEISGAQHAFDIFPSIRSAHVVRGAERFLSWTYRQATAQQPPTPTDPDESAPTEVAAPQG
ncbi:alpha/beta hydrolase [Rhodococcus sp. X156]|uniref:alpha/beta hydrolase n=1 Tax=Rhodococcus sp. X156 TaxID=2499145 RepID=UPI001F4986D3|nr:alpha/beta hydrolase [Rhodococcus sp. X156]